MTSTLPVEVKYCKKYCNIFSTNSPSIAIFIAVLFSNIAKTIAFCTNSEYVTWDFYRIISSYCQILQKIKDVIASSEGFPFQHALFQALAENKEEIVDSFVKKFDLKILLTHSWSSNYLYNLYNLYNEVGKIASMRNLGIYVYDF